MKRGRQKEEERGRENQQRKRTHGALEVKRLSKCMNPPEMKRENRGAGGNSGDEGRNLQYEMRSESKTSRGESGGGE